MSALLEIVLACPKCLRPVNMRKLPGHLAEDHLMNSTEAWELHLQAKPYEPPLGVSASPEMTPVTIESDAETFNALAVPDSRVYGNPSFDDQPYYPESDEGERPNKQASRKGKTMTAAIKAKKCGYCKKLNGDHIPTCKRLQPCKDCERAVSRGVDKCVRHGGESLPKLARTRATVAPKPQAKSSNAVPTYKKPQVSKPQPVQAVAPTNGNGHVPKDEVVKLLLEKLTEEREQILIRLDVVESIIKRTEREQEAVTA